MRGRLARLQNVRVKKRWTLSIFSIPVNSQGFQTGVLGLTDFKYT